MITTTQRTFPQRIGYLTTCVIPADLLSDESTDPEDSASLRAAASRNGLSFTQITSSLEEGIYLARVAASPTQLATGYTVLFNEQQLSYALPWEARLEWADRTHEKKRRPESILALLRAHAAEVQPLVAGAASRDVPTPLADASLTPLDTVEVPAKALQEALAQIKNQNENKASFTHHSAQQFCLQQALLQAMIDTLMQQLYQAQERAYALTIKARCLLLAQLQRWHRVTRYDRIVNAVPRFSSEQHQVVWNLTVGLPVAA